MWVNIVTLHYTYDEYCEDVSTSLVPSPFTALRTVRAMKVGLGSTKETIYINNIIYE